mmetsp:Transcript_3084/g.12406  ORF Transcript_3084/g.12406 Transcript_3084/m.12406 type:complete len:271 (-) Transcript_3084:19-831(-)
MLSQSLWKVLPRKLRASVRANDRSKQAERGLVGPAEVPVPPPPLRHLRRGRGRRPRLPHLLFLLPRGVSREVHSARGAVQRVLRDLPQAPGQGAASGPQGGFLLLHRQGRRHASTGGQSGHQRQHLLQVARATVQEGLREWTGGSQLVECRRPLRLLGGGSVSASAALRQDIVAAIHRQAPAARGGRVALLVREAQSRRAVQGSWGRLGPTRVVWTRLLEPAALHRVRRESDATGENLGQGADVQQLQRGRGLRKSGFRHEELRQESGLP